MNILIVGSGGREHALAWRLHQDGHAVSATGDGPGISEVAAFVDAPTDDAIVQAAAAFDLVVIGPEKPLVDGLADRLREVGANVFGPGADGAQLEGSKAFSKAFFARHNIPTAPFKTVTTAAEADEAIAELGDVVVKYDGLAAGKGVVVAANADEARAAAREMLAGKFGDHAKVVIEKRIRGREVSVLALTDGVELEILPSAEDHKQIFDGDKGPNTGGMGTVSPAWISEDALGRIRREILEPTVRGLQAEGIDYRGVLYAGVMLDQMGVPWLLEYNCRFGDPETQVICARVRGDLGKALLGCARGALELGTLDADPRFAVCVIVAGEGYPGAGVAGREMSLPAEHHEVEVFVAGAAWVGGGRQPPHAGRWNYLAGTGRVLGVTALGFSVEQARERAYAYIDRIELTGKQFRRDIGLRPA